MNKTGWLRTVGPGVLLSVALAFAGAAHADLFTAQLAYHQGDYDQAFKDYRDLAELGQPIAQFNLAIMYARGQGVRQSEINAYAWASIAADNGNANARQLADRLRPDLAPGSEKIADEIRSRFGPQALDERLMPKIEFDEFEIELERMRCRPVRVYYPEYPPEARSKGLQGSVYAEFTLLPDGSARNPRIVYALPSGVFGAAVRESLLRSRFVPVNSDTKSVQCAIYYNFAMNDVPAGDYPGLAGFVTKTRIQAEAGDANAELLYGMLLAGVPQLKRPRSEALPWFLKAAQAGSPLAQYQVGYSLLKGWGCHYEENKGSEWLRRAAEQDQPDAQVALAEYSLHGTPDEDSVKRAKAWLDRAAASGNRDGKLYLAALLASAPYSDVRDPPRSLSLVDAVFKGVKDDPTAHEILAAAQAASGHFADASASEVKAINMASRLSWNLAPLKERLARYQSQQPWYGDLLGF